MPNRTRASTAYVIPGMLPATITMSWKKALHHRLVPIRYPTGKPIAKASPKP